MAGPFALLVEGDLDEAVGRRIVRAAGGEIGVVYPKRGIGYIRTRLAQFDQSAQHVPLLVLADLADTRYPCPPALIEAWLPEQRGRTVFRIVEQMIESWLFADRKGIAHYLRVSVDRIPHVPESLPNPKAHLARESRSATIRNQLVPRGSTARVGPGYSSLLRRFVDDQWNLDMARRQASSLDRCLRAVSAEATR